MSKKHLSRLVLTKETIRQLNDSRVAEMNGGTVTDTASVSLVTIVSVAWCPTEGSCLWTCGCLKTRINCPIALEQ